jgi:hypothetical protein
MQPFEPNCSMQPVLSFNMNFETLQEFNGGKTHSSNILAANFG